MGIFLFSPVEGNAKIKSFKSVNSSRDIELRRVDPQGKQNPKKSKGVKKGSGMYSSRRTEVGAARGGPPMWVAGPEALEGKSKIGPNDFFDNLGGVKPKAAGNALKKLTKHKVSKRGNQEKNRKTTPLGPPAKLNTQPKAVEASPLNVSQAK